MKPPEGNATTPAFRAPGTGDWCGLEAENGDDKGKQEEARRARDKLKNILLSSLQMQHLVVLAGSGCSRSAGGPSMQDLWNGSVGREPTAKAKKVAKKVHYDLEKANIEAFLSRAEAFLQVQEDQAVSEFLYSSKQVILDKCSSFPSADKLGAHKVFLHRLSRRRVRDQRLQVFTTNYDLCFERAAAELGGVALDGFSFTAPRQYDPRYFGYDIIRRPRSGDDLGHYLEGVFLLYKLHGSVKWARDVWGGIYEKDKPTPAEACLIYPARGKYQQSFVQPHLESMAQYLAAVREPNTCLLAIGFGFNDNHLSEPLLGAMQSNPHLRLIIVDQSAAHKETDSDASPLLRDLFQLGRRGEDVWFIKASFEDFAQIIPDLKSLTPAETLMKAVEGIAKGYEQAEH